MAEITREQVVERCRHINCFEFNDIVGKTDEKAIRWLQSVGIVPYLNMEHLLCPETGDNDHQVHIRTKRDTITGYSVFCHTCYGNTGRKIEHTLTKGTWLEHTHLSPSKVVQVTFAFIMRLGVKQTVHHCNVSKPAVIDWFNFCRKVCEESNGAEVDMVGGDGHIVEVK